MLFCYLLSFSDKIRPLSHNGEFPLPASALNALKSDIKDATLLTVDSQEPFEVETDASDYCIAATLNQKGRPVAFFSRTLNRSEIKQHAVEKEAAAIVESLKQWRHSLLGKHFSIITDQKSISYMYDSKHKSKIKNNKIARWRVELSQYKFDIVYRPGKDNVVADTLTRIAALSHPLKELHELHEQLCHPGIT